MRLSNLFALTLFSSTLIVGGALLAQPVPPKPEKSYWTETMVRQYAHNSDLQRRWAWSLMAQNQFRGDEWVLDIGSGDGKISADISRFVPRGKVVAIDLAEPMVRWAKMQHHPAEYPNLIFREGSFLKPGVTDSFDLIVSFCAMHFVDDQLGALKEMKKHLKPKGKVMMTFPAFANDAWNKSREIVQARPKWQAYWQTPPNKKITSANTFEELIKQAGLTPVQVKTVETMDPFVDRKEYIEWLKGVFPPVLPRSLQDEFFSELLEQLIALRPDTLASDGSIFARFNRIEAIAQNN